jgi:hypothetical protein
MRTITIFNPETGELGPILTSDGFIGRYDENKNPLFIEGAYDISTKKLDLVTMEIVDKAPRKPLLHELQDKRNNLLDTYRWTIMPDSPLSETSKTEWLLWLQTLQSLLIGITDQTTDTVVWPEKPNYEYT